jgi:methyl-accepting chemotaxis protein
MKIGSRLVLGFGVNLLFLLIVGLVGLYEIKHVSDVMDDVIKNESKVIEYAQRSRTNINMMRRYEKDAFINIEDLQKIDDYKKKWDGVFERAKERLDAISKIESDSKKKELLAEINKNLNDYSKGFEKVLAQIKAGEVKTTQDANKAIGEFKEATHKSESMITEYAKLKDEEMEKHKKELDSEISSLIVKISVFVAFSFTVMFILVTFLVRSITKPLVAIDHLIHDIAIGEGDLTRRLEYRGKDELGSICNGFNLFMDKLHGIITTISSNTTQVASAATQLMAAAEQIATGAEQVASQAGTVATAGEEMSATSGDMAQNCQMAAEGSNQASHAARAGSEVVSNTVLVMGRIASRVQETAKTVGSLGARSDQIGAIVATIQDIADQTNLLALNAAIEAARAGEQGRGFAVVADEVRALAERTTKATREISEMIKAIQNETRGAVSAMEAGVQEVEQGTIEASKSGQALQEILEQINAVTMQVNQVATAAEEQTATTGEISNNIQQITEVIQMTARGAHESANAAGQLASTATELERIVSHFKL